MADTAQDARSEREKYQKMWEVSGYRTVSPGFYALSQLDVIDRFRKYGVRSILDAGCGSGKASRYIMETFPGEFDVRGFDIAENCLDPFFDDKRDRYLSVGCLWNEGDIPGVYDGVICFDVMEHIPTENVPATLANLRRATLRVAFFGIALFPDNFGPAVLGEPLHLTVESPEWWGERLAEAGYHVAWWNVVSAGDGPGWLLCFVLPVADLGEA